MVDLVERIDALLGQEEAFYKTADYLSHGINCASSVSDSSSESLTSSNGSSSVSDINESWRRSICEWSFEVTDHFELSREIVSLAMNFLDRFLMKKWVDKKIFQLAAITCVHLASKLLCDPGGKVTMDTMIELSRGFFTVADMKEMELELLSVLGWHVHPPTPFCFSKHFLFLVPYTAIKMDVRHDILELTRFLTELSVIDYFFVSKKASSVALAALLNAMDEIPEVSDEAMAAFATEMQRISGVNMRRPDVLDCRERLRLLYAQGGYARPEPQPETRSEAISPVCVSYGLPTSAHQASMMAGQDSFPSKGTGVGTNNLQTNSSEQTH